MTIVQAFAEILNSPNACMIMDISMRKVIQYRYMFARNIVNSETMEIFLKKARYVKIADNEWQQPPSIKVFPRY